MIKLAKTLLPIAWMGLIFVLSGIPVGYFPESAAIFQQIAAHNFLYFVLSLLIIIAILSWRIKAKMVNAALTAVAVSVLYGISDEYHQGFVYGRFVSFADLFFDFFGACLGVIFYLIIHKKRKAKILLHVCCAGCGAYIGKLLKKDYNVVLYFYNPSIYPISEYNTRLAEAKRIAQKFNLKLLAEEYDHNKWLDKIKGHEHDSERGERCFICYKDRMESTAQKAQEGKFDYFSTTLTVSPRKDAAEISKIGKKMAEKYNVEFLDKDFKKKDGFKKSVELSKQLNLYRQNYCGCEFSGTQIYK
ncbi:epoxyqueuosine reductase QueH [Patescibacteria group bacterium]|nr:epoxyqueuosine reductase QueH [Patescibacteria group bacterium]MBU4600936.1 epoxyqueuosine reductase QueH [Patescibacteria group bacterium]MCG2697703.1 epoxyqueuosine reductase QueH [Candidatus Parcubacteria bacterium]